jgi:hypothetical protein
MTQIMHAKGISPLHPNAKTSESTQHRNKFFLQHVYLKDQNNTNPWPETASELYRLVGEVSANFLRIKGCRVVSAADHNDRNLGFLD